MRLIIATLSFLLTYPCMAQLELVGSFDNTARLIYLSDNEPALFFYDPLDEHIELYNTDLTLIASFDIPIEYDGFAQYNLFHVSRTLFDCDASNIEYMLSYQSQVLSETYVKIIREDGTIIFDLPEHIFADESIVGTNPSYYSAMVGDENGVLFTFHTGTNLLPGSPTSVYRSCGSIPGYCSPCNSDSLNVGVVEVPEERNQFNLYPNPGNNEFAIAYELSKNYTSATLSLFDMTGKEVLQKKVGPSVNFIIVDTSALAAGRYQVVLSAEDGILISTSYIEID